MGTFALIVVAVVWALFLVPLLICFMRNGSRRPKLGLLLVLVAIACLVPVAVYDGVLAEFASGVGTSVGITALALMANCSFTLGGIAGLVGAIVAQSWGEPIGWGGLIGVLATLLIWSIDPAVRMGSE